MKHQALVDAGPLVSLLRRRDRDHEACVAALDQLRRPLLTTWAPMTEAMYLLDPAVDAQCALLEMLERKALQIVELEHSDFTPIKKLMRKYVDLPMGFADATLVRVAERLQVRHVFTLDHRDFGIYRLPGRRKLTTLP